MAGNAPTNAALLTGQQPANPIVIPLGGPSSQRPANPPLYTTYFDTTLNQLIVWTGSLWQAVAPTATPGVVPPQVPGFGVSGGRPAAPYNGYLYFNTTLGGLESWNGQQWVFIGPYTAPATPGPTPAASPPTIITQPQSQTVATSASVTFTVTASGTGSLSYQWFFNNVSIGGATSNSYTIGSVAQSNGGSYYVTVTGSTGSVTSIAVTLTVTGAVYFVSSPASQTVTVGQSTSFSVQVTGTNPLTYQWCLNTVNIPGANSPTYNIASATLAQAGTYTCAVTNVSGTSISGSATLTVNVAPVSFSCTSFSATAVALAGQDTTCGFFWNAAGGADQQLSVSLSSIFGNLPAGFILSLYDNRGNLISQTNSVGSTQQISITIDIGSTAATSSNTATVTTSATSPVEVQFTVTSSGPLVYTNASILGPVYGPVIFPPNGYSLALGSTTCALGSQASADFTDGQTQVYKTAPFYNWSFSSGSGTDTTSNPKLNFATGRQVALNGGAAGSIISSSRLDLNPPGVP